VYSKLPEHIVQSGSEFGVLYTVLNRFRSTVIASGFVPNVLAACIFLDRSDAFASFFSRIEDEFLRTDLQGAFSSALV
jgi:hypothetical protein